MSVLLHICAALGIGQCHFRNFLPVSANAFVCRAGYKYLWEFKTFMCDEERVSKDTWLA